MKRVFFITMFVFLIGCSSLENKSNLFVLSVDNTGIDGKAGEFCSDFDLSKDEAQSFFERAQLISFKQLHDDYSFLPCFVRGKAQLKKLICDWEIRAGGTGEITCGENVYIYGCANCDDILK